MRRLAWCVFQLGFMYWCYRLFADDPNFDMRRHGGMIPLPAFIMSGVATMILMWFFDLWMRFYNWAQHPPTIGARTLLLRFLARRRDRRLHRLIGKQGADNIRLAHPAARTGDDLPKQIR